MPRYSYSPDALARLVTNASLKFWGLTPYPWQLEAVTKWLDQTIPESSAFPAANLLCRATGGGKSMTFKAFGAVTGGVVLIIVPSLSLGADQMLKLEQAKDKSVTGLHLDDITDAGWLKVEKGLRKITSSQLLLQTFLRVVVYL